MGPVQLYDALEEAYRQLLETVDQFPETAFHQPSREGVWSIAKIVEHVMRFMATYEQAICMVREQGLQPPDVNGRREILLRQEPVKRIELLTALQSSLQHLAHTVHQTEPDSHLEVTWKHFELGRCTGENGCSLRVCISSIMFVNYKRCCKSQNVGIYT